MLVDLLAAATPAITEAEAGHPDNQLRVHRTFVLFLGLLLAAGIWALVEIDRVHAPLLAEIRAARAEGRPARLGGPLEEGRP